MYMKFKTNTINDTQMVYSILREQYPKKAVDIKYNNGEYIIVLTNEPFTSDPNVPVDIMIKIIYGDTDSIFASVKFNRDDFERNRKDTFKVSKLCGDLLTNKVFNRRPIEMEFEKVFQPFILLTKKRYIGKKFDNFKNPFELSGITASGIAITRRDYCQMVKNCYKKVIDFIMENKLPDAIAVYRHYIDKIANYDLPSNELTVSASLAKNYSCAECKTKCEWTCIDCEKCKMKRGTSYKIPRGNIKNGKCPVCSEPFKCVHTFSLAHVNLGCKMLVRKEDITVNDRIQYIFVEPAVSGIKSSGKKDLAEEQSYAQTHSLKFNRACYTEQLAKPLLAFFKVVLEPKHQAQLIEYTNSKMIMYGGAKLKPSDFIL